MEIRSTPPGTDGGPDAPPARSVTIPREPGVVMAALDRAAEVWGADFEPDGGGAVPRGGRLDLPVAAGLRHGHLAGRVRVEPDTEPGREPSSRLVFEEERAVYHLWTPAVVVLALAVAGGLVTVVWPLYPQLLEAAPFGALLALSGWLLVASRLKHRGVAELFALVEEIATDDVEDAVDGPEEGESDWRRGDEPPPDDRFAPPG